MDILKYKMKLIVILSVMVLSCNTSPKPDKVIRVTLEFENKLISEQEINQAIAIIKKRMYKVCILQEIRRVANKKQIYIEAATHFDTKRITDLLTHSGKLDFYETHQPEDLMSFVMRVNELSKKGNEEENPLLDLFTRQGYQGGGILFYASEKDTSKVNALLSLKAASPELPVAPRFVKFLWGMQETGTDEFPLYAVRPNRQLRPAISGNVITESRQGFDQLGRPVINIQMNEDGAKKWEALTGKVFQDRTQIAMVIDNRVYSAPGVSSGAITGGRSQISGDFTLEDTQDLAIILGAGILPKVILLDSYIEKLTDQKR